MIEKDLKSARSGRMKILLLALLLLPALVAHGFLATRELRELCDDAMISARYARNLAWGHGLRYNLPSGPGKEVERPVEGYSNFLWVLGLAAGFRLDLHPRMTTAVMGIGFSLLAVLGLGLWVFRETGSTAGGFFAAAILASSLPFALWAGQGLETPLFAALALSAIALDRPDRGRPLPYLLAFLAGLVRPEGVLLPGAIFIAHLLQPRPRRFIAPLFFLVPFALYTRWRVLYFGSALPNVFYAKTGLGPAGLKVGAFYLEQAALDQWPVLLLLFSVGATLLSPRLSQPDKNVGPTPGLQLLTPLVFIALYLLFILAVGGDFMPDHRFVMHVLPLIIGIGAIGCLGRNKSRGRLWIFIAFAVLAVSWNGWKIWKYEREPSFARDWHRNQAEWYGRPASWLLREARPADLIAAGDIGYIGYVTETNPILDTNGLTDPYLARRPGAAGFNSDPDYVLSRKPEFLVVMVHYFENGQALGHSAFDRAVLAGDRLNREYALKTELPGWRSVETSFPDRVTRGSQVRFRIYQRLQAPGGL